MSLCLYVCMSSCLYVFMSGCIYFLCIFMSVCLYICMYLYLYVFIFVCLYICMSLRLCVFMYVCLLSFVYMSLCLIPIFFSFKTRQTLFACNPKRPKTNLPYSNTYFLDIWIFDNCCWLWWKIWRIFLEFELQDCQETALKPFCQKRVRA